MRSGSTTSEKQEPSTASASSSTAPRDTNEVFGKRLGAIVFGILSALVIIEVGFRIAGSALPKPAKWNDRPAVYYLPEKSHGRDRIFSPAKPENTFRIVVVGDSFTEPGENHFDDSFSKRLERMLNLNAQQKKVEVMNWGVPGRSTAQELPLVQRAIAGFQPDLIVLQITLNDPELAPYRATHDVHKSAVSARDVGKYWRSLGYILHRISNSRSRIDYEHYYFDLFERPETWNHFSRSLEKASATAQSAGVPLLAVLFPLFSHTLDDSYPFQELHRKVDLLAASMNVKFLDLFPFYRDIPPDRLQVRPGKDSHPNEIAHRIAADAIYSRMIELNLIPLEVRGKNRSRNRDGKHKIDGSIDPEAAIDNPSQH